MIKLSIIIPIYNGEDFIERALNSIPVRDDIEIICIDDCSTDSTLNILKNYTRLQLNIIHNDNNYGVGVATAIGMDNATGEYITALEIDDWFLTDVFNECIDTISLGQFDIYNFSYIENNGDIRPGTNISGLPGKWIRRSFIGAHRFRPLRIHADVFFMKEIRTLKPKEIFLNKAYYRYNYPRKGSISYAFEHPGKS